MKHLYYVRTAESVLIFKRFVKGKCFFLVGVVACILLR